MFFCLSHQDGRPAVESSLPLPGRGEALGSDERVQHAVAGPFGAAVRLGGSGRSTLARRRYLLGVGDVRLDNRAEVEGWGRGPLAGDSDLDAVLAAFEVRGEACLPGLLGDFAFAIWDARAQRLTAVRDALGVKPLYYAAGGGRFTVASRLSDLEGDGRVDPEYVADFLMRGGTITDRTIWAAARSLPPGSVLTQRGNVVAVRRYWSPEDFEPADRADEAEACAEFRVLLREAVRVRLARDGQTWAQLSGGLDSSSVVALAGRIAAERGDAPGVSGTITVVDTLGDGDERAFSDAVVRRLGLRNETVVDLWAWQDDGQGPPLTDEPRVYYPFFARDRRMYGIIRAAGGRVLLTGMGPDHYLTGNEHYLTDLVARGRIGSALREMAGWAVAGKGSFWKLLRRYGIAPFVPAFGGPRAFQLPAWLEPGFARAVVAERANGAVPGAPGERFVRATAEALLRLPTSLPPAPSTEGVELRHPFLYRPLIEHSLRLPVSLRMRPGARKWILRQAMRGILPEEVRTRRGKGGIDARIVWSLERERHRLAALLREPVLADLGCIRPDALRAAVDEARTGAMENVGPLLMTLALETWLAVRGGRWRTEQNPASSAA